MISTFKLYPVLRGQCYITYQLCNVKQHSKYNYRIHRKTNKSNERFEGYSLSLTLNKGVNVDLIINEYKGGVKSLIFYCCDFCICLECPCNICWSFQDFFDLFTGFIQYICYLNAK